MEIKNNSVFQFISQTLTLFAVNILMLMVLAATFGEGAKTISSLYQFGTKGLATTTMLQFLLSSASVIILKNIFFSERIIKKLMTLWRTIFMLFGVLAINIIFILLFDWFSFENAYAWIGFFLCFGGGCIFGSLIMILKTRMESRQYDELLSNYKFQQERDRDNE